MDISPINTSQKKSSNGTNRPLDFSDFVGQEQIKKVLKTALGSSKVSGDALGHMLFSGESGYGKTTLAQLVAHQMGCGIKIITWYAITKPAEMVSMLNSLNTNDILFIDEIHRLKSNVEEVLYIAMEDYRIDMVMPDGGSISIPLQPFTLIGATTQLEKLSTPLKNRCIYKFHFTGYSPSEQQAIMQRYLTTNHIELKGDKKLLADICSHLTTVPREISNFCVQLKDYLIDTYGENDLVIDALRWEQFWNRSKLQKGGITPLHQHYLSILNEAEGNPVGLKTLAVKLGMNEQSVEDDIEPLLFKLNKIEKTAKGRTLK